jgi:hypothetical protein
MFLRPTIIAEQRDRLRMTVMMNMACRTID